MRRDQRMISLFVRQLLQHYLSGPFFSYIQSLDVYTCQFQAILQSQVSTACLIVYIRRLFRYIQAHYISRHYIQASNDCTHISISSLVETFNPG